MLLCEGIPMSYIPLGSSEPSLVPCPPARISSATFPSFILSAPHSFISVVFCSSKLALNTVDGSKGIIECDEVSTDL